MYNNLAIIHTMSDDTTGSPQPTSLKSALKRPTTSEELQEPEGSPPRSRRDAADAKEIQAVLDKPIYETPYDMATSCTQNRNRCFMSRNKPTDPEYINEWKLCHTSPGEDAEDGCRYSTHLERVIPDCVKADTSRCPRPSAGASRDSQYLDWQEWYDGDSEFGDWWKGVKFSQGTKRTVDQRPYDQYSKEHRGKEALDPLGVTPEERAARADPYYRGEEVFPSGFTPQDKEAARQAMQADAAEAAAAASSSSVGGRRTKRRKSKRKPSKKRHGRKTSGRKTRQVKRNKRKTKRHTRRGRKTRGRKTRERKTKKRRNVRHKRKTRARRKQTHEKRAQIGGRPEFEEARRKGWLVPGSDGLARENSKYSGRHDDLEALLKVRMVRTPEEKAEAAAKRRRDEERAEEAKRRRERERWEKTYPPCEDERLSPAEQDDCFQHNSETERYVVSSFRGGR